MKKAILIILILLMIPIYINNVTPNLGIDEGQLKPLKASPNGVSSYSEDKYVEAFLYSEDTMSDLKSVALSLGGDLITEDNNYMHFVFSTRLGFKDDVEFYYDGQLIQFRSQSRLGYSDMGLNLSRYNMIREKIESLLD